MVKAIKVMLIPNNVQKTKMFQYAGASRFAYNWALARKKKIMKKVANSFQIQNSEKNLQSSDILRNTHGC
ncbi:MAG: helix-turn-helix domain-containing protein [Dorea formicigenerans]